MPPNPALALPNVGIDGFPPTYPTVITQNYYYKALEEKLTPNLSEAIALINHYYSYEYVFSLRSHKHAIVANSWQPWVN